MNNTETSYGPYETRACLSKAYEPGYMNILVYLSYLFAQMQAVGCKSYDYTITYKEGSVYVYIRVIDAMHAFFFIIVQKDAPVRGRFAKASMCFTLTFPFYAPATDPGLMERMREILDPPTYGGSGRSPFDIFSIIEAVRLSFLIPRKAKATSRKSTAPRNTLPLELRPYFTRFRRLADHENQSDENREQIRRYGTPEMQMICDRDHATTCWSDDVPHAGPGHLQDED